MSAAVLSEQGNVQLHRWLVAILENNVPPALVGATFGPLLIPIACVRLLRRAKLKRAGGVWAWLWVAAAVLATSAWFGWGVWFVELP